MPTPSDSWYEGEVACVTFALRSKVPREDLAQAIFVLSLMGQLLAARTIEMDDAGNYIVQDLLTSGDPKPLEK